MSLDGILNVIVPLGIFIAIAIFIYHKGQKPIDNVISKIKDWVSEKTPEFTNPEDYILGYRKADY